MPGGYAPKSEERSQIIRHLQTDGKLGEIPDWYRTIVAAQELSVPPWELMRQPLIWQEWALSARRVRAFVESERANKSKVARGHNGD